MVQRLSQYAVLVTMESGEYEVYGPFSSSRSVEHAREHATGLAWVSRASVIAIHSPRGLYLDVAESNRRVV